MNTTQNNWNLSDLYESPTDSAIAADFKRLDELVTKLESYRGKIGDLSPAKLLPLIKLWEEVGKITHKLGLYAGLLEVTNIGDAKTTRFEKMTTEKLIARGTRIIFIEAELAQLSKVQWQKYLKSPVLKIYRHTLEKLHEGAKHTLSEPEEKILALKSQTSANALLHLYSLTIETLNFELDGKTVTLEALMSRFHDCDPAVRKEAAFTLHAGLDTTSKTTPTILNALVYDKAISDRLRHYEYPQQARFQSDDVDKVSVEALITAVNANHHIITRYYALKQKLLGTDQLYWWDRYAPLPETSAAIPIAQGKELVIEAYNDFSPQLAEIVKQMITKRHIDWLPSPTKKGGAFCASGESGQYPYILLNYMEQPRDVMTLAHELGHAVHDVLADANNPFLEVHPSLALAEVASVFGETLLFERLLKYELSKQDKIALLMSFIEDRFATVFRQISMFEFESALHEKRRQEGELSKEEIDTLWDEIMKRPFEKALRYTPEHKNTWMYVGHIFHWPFYVYSYSFAQMCVLALYGEYKTKDKAEFVLRYHTILSMGGSLSPKDTLKQAGFDLGEASFWTNGLKTLDGFIDQLEELC